MFICMRINIAGKRFVHSEFWIWWRALALTHCFSCGNLSVVIARITIVIIIDIYMRMIYHKCIVVDYFAFIVVARTSRIHRDNVDFFLQRQLSQQYRRRYFERNEETQAISIKRCHMRFQNSPIPSSVYCCKFYGEFRMVLLKNVYKLIVTNERSIWRQIFALSKICAEWSYTLVSLYAKVFILDNLPYW